MSDNPQNGRDAQNSNGGEPNSDNMPTTLEDALGELKTLRERLSEVNSESAQRRHQLKTMQEQIEALRGAQHKQLEESGNYQALYQQTNEKLAALAPKAERAEQLDALIRESNERRVAQVREDLRPLIPADYTPEKLAAWLDSNISRLTAPAAPDLDAGVRGSSVKPQLSEAERAIARRFGMTDEAYLKYKQRVGGS